MNKSCDLKHPPCRVHSAGHTAFPKNDPRHVALLDRVGRGYVDRPAQVVVVDYPLEGVAEIVFVNPGNPLVTACYGTSQSPAGEASECPVYSAAVCSKDHRGAHGDCPGVRGRLIVG